MKQADGWIEKLGLIAHPEGGYYREVYRSADLLKASCLPAPFEGERSVSTAIYYLLEQNDFSAFHRINSDEIWHHYAGGILTIYSIEPGLGELSIQYLGVDDDKSTPMLVIPHGHWFAAQPAQNCDFVLVGCTVAPGFDFADFQLAERKTLTNQFPQHADLINALTR